MIEARTASYERWVDLETRGEAICRTHARQARNPDQRAKWRLLAELECATKDALIRYLGANGIVVAESAEKRREGEILAEQSASVDWLDLMARLRPRILFYVDELRTIAAAAPAAQRALAARLCEHEEAWLTFVDRELNGGPETSIQPIREHLAKWRDHDGESTGDSRPLGW